MKDSVQLFMTEMVLKHQNVFQIYLLIWSKYCLNSLYSLGYQTVQLLSQIWSQNLKR